MVSGIKNDGVVTGAVEKQNDKRGKEAYLSPQGCARWEITSSPSEQLCRGGVLCKKAFAWLHVWTHPYGFNSLFSRLCFLNQAMAKGPVWVAISQVGIAAKTTSSFRGKEKAGDGEDGGALGHAETFCLVLLFGPALGWG